MIKKDGITTAKVRRIRRKELEFLFAIGSVINTNNRGFATCLFGIK